MAARQAHVPAKLGWVHGNSPSWNLEAIVADLPLNTRMERHPVRLGERAAEHGEADAAALTARLDQVAALAAAVIEAQLGGEANGETGDAD